MKTAAISKRAVFSRLVGKGCVSVHFDPRVVGVELPPFLDRNSRETLDVGYDLPCPIPDLAFDEKGVSATLSFREGKALCVVPWGSVFALVSAVDGKGMVWEEDIPDDVKRDIEARNRASGHSRTSDSQFMKSN